MTTYTYTYSPSPTAAPVTFKLEGNALTVDRGSRIDIVQLGSVDLVRLTYEPRGFAQRSFRTRLTVRNGRTVSLASLSWKSLVEAQNQRAEYRTFVTALIRAVGAANPDARFLVGRSFAVWVGAVILAIVIFGAITFFMWRALQSGATAAAAMGAALALAGIWQIEPMIRLNRPRAFSPSEVPRALLP